MKQRFKLLIWLLISFVAFTLVFRKAIFLRIYQHFAFTPKVKLTNKEKIFIDSLKKTCNCYHIYRTPEYQPEYYTKNNTYEIVLDIYRVKINQKDSLKAVAFKIAHYSYMNIHKKDTSIFTQYKVTFWGKEKTTFQFKYKDLEAN